MKATQLTDKGIIVLREGEWVLYKDLVEQGWTIEYFKQKLAD